MSSWCLLLQVRERIFYLKEYKRFFFISGEGNLSSASASNLLDVTETASEAWSMDVLASDSESTRWGDLDNEDSASVARSDDTRFTDDTTRR